MQTDSMRDNRCKHVQNSLQSFSKQKDWGDKWETVNHSDRSKGDSNEFVTKNLLQINVVTFNILFIKESF